MSKDFEPKVLAFLCNWCSYAGADLAGISRFNYSPNIRIIRVPCSGRVSPILILKALAEGLDGVLVSGCHPGDCHYAEGNYHTRRRMTLLKKLLDYMGVDGRRLQLSWVSASEGKKWADVVNEAVEEVRKAGPNPFREKRKPEIRSTPVPASPGKSEANPNDKKTK